MLQEFLKRLGQVTGTTYTEKEFGQMINQALKAANKKGSNTAPKKNGGDVKKDKKKENQK